MPAMVGFLRGFSGILVAVVITAVVEPFVIRWLTRLGWYEQPENAVVVAVNWLSRIIGEDAFPWVAAAILGFAGGVWLEVLARRFDASRPTKQQLVAMEQETLAGKLIDTAYAMEQFVRYPLLYEAQGPQIQSHIYIVSKELDSRGYAVPMPEPGTLDEQFTWMAGYFRALAPLVQSGRIEDAKRLGLNWGKRRRLSGQ
jgi:hypothetical protein